MTEETIQERRRIPRGINIYEPAHVAGPEVEMCPSQSATHRGSLPDNRQSCLSVHQQSWCYLFVHHTKVRAFAAELERSTIRYFIHKTVKYQRSKHSRGIQPIEQPTVSGLIFLQGEPRELQTFLAARFPSHHLVNDCSTRLPAVIPHSVMEPFMRVLDTSPERVRFLLHPFRYYASRNILLRITSGFLAGLAGYVIRIDRDRRLVMNVGGMSVAISGVHCEKFEVVG